MRHWPKVSREYLARLFPDGKTVHIPADGRPMPGYQLALAEIQSRGKEVVPVAAFASRSDADEGDSDAAGDGGRMKRLFASIFSKKNGSEDDDGKIAAVRAQPAPRIASNAKANPEPTARPVAVASLSPATPAPGPQLQWTKGPDSVAATTGSVAPLPRARPMEAGSNAALASLPLNGRQVASADVTASLPLAITGGEKPTSALGYAAPEAVPQRISAPIAPQTAAIALAPAAAGCRPPAGTGPFARLLWRRRPFAVDPAQPDSPFSSPPTCGIRINPGLTILLDPVATTAGYFAHQSGGKIVTGSLASAC